MGDFEDRELTFNTMSRIRVANPNLWDRLKEHFTGPHFVRTKVRVDPTQIIELEESLDVDGKSLFYTLSTQSVSVERQARQEGPEVELLEHLREKIIEQDWAAIGEIAKSLLKNFNGGPGGMHILVRDSALVGSFHDALSIARSISGQTDNNSHISELIRQVIVDLSIEA